jgi:hypothetical protein
MLQAYLWFLGTLAKLRKATVSLMSVHPSVYMEQLDSHWTDFHEISYLSIFRKSIEKIQVPLKSEKITGALRGDLCTFMTISR